MSAPSAPPAASAACHPEGVAAGCVADAEHLAALLGRPLLRTAGATGVLNPCARCVIRVWDPGVDLLALLGELAALPIPPELLVLDTVTLDHARLRGAGWRFQEDVVQVRHDQPTTLAVPCPSGYVLRPADRADLPGVRRLLDDSFGTDDTDVHLPDDVLDVPGIRLVAAVHGDGSLAGTVGTRPTRDGALLFGLATSRQHQGRGLGRSLAAAAGCDSARRGAARVTADTTPALLPFYERLGFRPHLRWRRYGNADHSPCA